MNDIIAQLAIGSVIVVATIKLIDFALLEPQKARLESHMQTLWIVLDDLRKERIASVACSAVIGWAVCLLSVLGVVAVYLAMVGSWIERQPGVTNGQVLLNLLLTLCGGVWSLAVNRRVIRGWVFKDSHTAIVALKSAVIVLAGLTCTYIVLACMFGLAEMTDVNNASFVSYLFWTSLLLVSAAFLLSAYYIWLILFLGLAWLSYILVKLLLSVASGFVLRVVVFPNGPTAAIGVVVVAIGSILKLLAAR